MNLANDNKPGVVKGTAVEETAMNKSSRGATRHAMMLKKLVERLFR